MRFDSQRRRSVLAVESCACLAFMALVLLDVRLVHSEAWRHAAITDACAVAVMAIKAGMLLSLACGLPITRFESPRWISAYVAAEFCVRILFSLAVMTRRFDDGLLASALYFFIWFEMRESTLNFSDKSLAVRPLFVCMIVINFALPGFGGLSDIDFFVTLLYALGLLFFFFSTTAVTELERRRRWTAANHNTLLRERLAGEAATEAEVAAAQAALAQDGLPAEEQALLARWRVPWAAVSLRRPLGAGSFAEVWSCEYEGRALALKRLHRERQADPECLLRFRGEVLTMCRLRHRNVARFVGAVWCVIALLGHACPSSSLAHAPFPPFLAAQGPAARRAADGAV